MSAHRIKIKPRRDARKPAATTLNSSITPSDIFGGRAGDFDDDDGLDLEPELTEAELEAQYQAISRDLAHRFPNGFLKTAGLADRSAPTPPVAPAVTSRAHASTPCAPGHSTGPRTAEGKSRSSHNAMKHGLTITAGSALVFLSSEEADAYFTLNAHFTQQFVPMTGAEREIVREIVDALALARRARGLQTSALDNGDERALALYLRYESAHLRAHNAAIKTLLVLQKDRRQRNQNHEKWNEPVHWGEFTFIFDDDPDKTDPPQSSAKAATSAPPPESDSSFRNPTVEPRPATAFSAPNARQAATGNAFQEVEPAA
jgi:hypothetical protein